MYYVSAADGNDLGPGTALRPWRTIGKAAGSLIAGDMALIRGGVYRESVQVTVNGTRDKRILIQAHPGEQVILDGSDPITGWTQCGPNEPGLTVGGVTNPHYADIYRAVLRDPTIRTLDDLVLWEANYWLQPSQEPSQTLAVLEDAREYTRLQDPNNWGQNLALWDRANRSQQDDYWKGAWLRIRSHEANNTILTVQIAGSRQSDGRLLFSEPLAHNLIRTGSTPDEYSILNHPHILDKAGEFYFAKGPGEAEWTVYLWPRDPRSLEGRVAYSSRRVAIRLADGAGSYVTLDGLAICSYAGAGPGTGGVVCTAGVHPTGCWVRNCQITNNAGYAGIHVGGTDTVIQANTVANVRYGYGILSGGSRTVVQGNSLSQTERTAIYVPGARQCRILSNTVQGAGNLATAIAVYSDANEVLIAGNVVTRGGFALALSHAAHVAVFNNCFHSQTAKVVADWGQCTGTNVILNNTVMSSHPEPQGVSLVSRECTWVVKNNILCGGVGGTRSHNLYTHLGAEQEAGQGWSKAEGELLETRLDTLFTDALQYDFRLRPSSPAVDTGIDVSAHLPVRVYPDFDFSRDLAGHRRDSRPDIGAFEYVPPDAANHAPALSAIQVPPVAERSLLTLSVRAADPDGDALTYSAGPLPAGARFSGGTFSWTPTTGQAGSHRVTFTAKDGRGGEDSQTVTILVSAAGGGNRAPELASIGARIAVKGTAVAFEVSAADADADPLTYSAVDLPSGASFAGSTFTWTPGPDQVGTYPVTFVAADRRGGQDWETVTITVKDNNRAPLLDAIGPKSVEAGSTLTFSVRGADPDDDPLTYSASGLPPGAAFSGTEFRWTPGVSHGGSHTVEFAVSDGLEQDSEAVVVTVTSMDRTAPRADLAVPPPDSIQVPANTLITVRVADAGDGVDPGSVTIEVQGQTAYVGNAEAFAGPLGVCRRSGTGAEYRYDLQLGPLFGLDQEVKVRVAARDFAGNTMDPVSWSFWTQMRPFGENIRISSGPTSLDKGRPAACADSRGRVWMAWHAGPPGARDVYAAWYDPATKTVAKASQLTLDTADQCNPALAVGANDRVYVVWQDNSRGNWDLCARWAAEGGLWSDTVKVIDSNENQVRPAICVDQGSAPRVYVAWQDDRAGNDDVYVAFTDDELLGPTVVRVTTDTAAQTDPAIAIGRDHAVYLVWTDLRNGSADLHGACSADGYRSNVPVVRGPGDQTEPDLAVEPTGSVLHLVWVDDRAGDKDVYYASTHGIPSSPLEGVNLIDDTGPADQSSPVIRAALTDRGELEVFACWQDARTVGTITDTDLYFADLGEGCSRTNVLVGDGQTNSPQSEPAMGVRADGHPFVVWTDGRNARTEVYLAGEAYARAQPAFSGLVLAGKGGTVGEPAAAGLDDVSVSVPAGALASDLTLGISRMENTPAAISEPWAAWDFGPSGAEFRTPVTVRIPYTAADAGVEPVPYWYNPLTEMLSQEGITDVQRAQAGSGLHCLTFKTTHFTLFVVARPMGSADP